MENCIVSFHYACTNLDKLKSQLIIDNIHVWSKAGKPCQSFGISPMFLGCLLGRRDSIRIIIHLWNQFETHNTGLFSHLCHLGLEMSEDGGDVVNDTLREITLLRRNHICSQILSFIKIPLLSAKKIIIQPDKWVQV